MSEDVLNLGSGLWNYSARGQPEPWRFFTGEADTLLRYLESRRFGEKGRFIAVCNVHMFMTARRDAALDDALRSATFALCDGQPIAWLASWATGRKVPRITGPDVFKRILLSSRAETKIALVGGSESTLRKIEALVGENAAGRLCVIDPGLVPPSGQPDPLTLRKLLDFKPDLVFVGLGCPKQEKWGTQAAKTVPSTFIGVGAAFGYLTGEIRRAPDMLQRLGLEWLYRLAQQPRLARRYGSTNFAFILLAARMVGAKLVGR